MEKLTLSPPWRIYYSKLLAMFGQDDDIKVIFDEDDCSIKFYVAKSKKAEVLNILLPEEKIFGNVSINIKIIPANKNSINFDYDKVADLYDILFKDNPVVDYIKTYESVLSNPLTYVVFKKEVVQFYSDNIGDINGFKSTLYEDIARDLFTSTKNDGVYFCTNITNVGTTIAAIKIDNNNQLYL